MCIVTQGLECKLKLGLDGTWDLGPACMEVGVLGGKRFYFGEVVDEPCMVESGLIRLWGWSKFTFGLGSWVLVLVHTLVSFQNTLF